MSWHFTEDHDTFRDAVGACLAADPARHTAMLTALELPGLPAGPRGWWTDPADGQVAGAVLVAPAKVPLLAGMPAGAARALAAEWPGRAGEVSAVRGESEAVEEFARATGRAFTVTRRMRLFRLGELTPQEPAPRGAARTAGTTGTPGASGTAGEADDLARALAWMREYARDVGEDPDADYRANVEGRIDDGRLWFWAAEDGEPVAMASMSPVVAGQARVSLVYTPPAHRGRGYGGAVTGAVSRAALDAGAAQVLLFTDLANPTSNALYQRLGYRPVRDHTAVAFG
ncbi:GNAT family N-acetyltransferase [Streptomyces sp. NPDC004327]|uniref:GNAT family N-acetyltransferase n=1 Tax=Streptomyces sp. NPDC004327 TaxID=3364699 RepID=UPI003689A083